MENANVVYPDLTFRALRAEEIDVRIQQIGNYKTVLLLYKDARVDQNILDETVGCLNWRKHYSRDNANCTIEVWDERKEQWIGKEDTGTESNTEKEKGLASDSFKRSGTCFGIGRELYTAPPIMVRNEYIDISEKNGRKTTYDTFFVRDLKVEEVKQGHTNIKFISKIGIGITHKGQSDWVYAWDIEKGAFDHKPEWIK